MRFDLAAGFPLLTTKKLHIRSIIHELLWFVSGDTNIRYLKENGVSIWDEWADEKGDLGPVYGKQWRSWQGPDGQTIDQLSDLITMIHNTPESRRLVLSAWNPVDVPNMALPDELETLTRPLIVGLTNSPERLIQVRRSRLRSLKEDGETVYVDPDAVREEVAQARRLFTDRGWPVIDVSRRSIEETAAAIITLFEQHKERLQAGSGNAGGNGGGA